MMENTNCTFYMDGGKKITRAIINKRLFTFGFAVSVDSQAYFDYSGERMNPNKKVVSLPGVPSHLIVLDDPQMIFEADEWEDFEGVIHPKVEYPATEWKWRNPELVCECGSRDYAPIGQDCVYVCNDCQSHIYDRSALNEDVV